MATTPAKPKFASTTSVPVETSRIEIQKLLERHKVTGFAMGYNQDREILSFELEGRRIRFEFLPLREEDFNVDGRNYIRTPAQRRAAVEQAHRTRWRELSLGIKAKLVMVAAGITTVESEFFAHIVLPNNQTLHQWAQPYLRNAYLSGGMPPLLPGGESDEGH